ncbi:MAG: hypothetical protein AAF869_01220 [Pseudomonadota bacterium]
MSFILSAVKIAARYAAILFGVLFILWVLAICELMVRKKLVRAKLPPGVYLAATNPIWEADRDIAMFRMDGVQLTKANLEFFCFNDVYIEAGHYIYKSGDAAALTYRDPGYEALVKESALSTNLVSCTGYTRPVVGFGILTDDPRFRWNWWDWWGPFGEDAGDAASASQP